MGGADLIGEAYRKMQRALHENPAYAPASRHRAPLVRKIMESRRCRGVA